MSVTYYPIAFEGFIEHPICEQLKDATHYITPLPRNALIRSSQYDEIHEEKVEKGQDERCADFGGVSHNSCVREAAENIRLSQ